MLNINIESHGLIALL